MKIHSCLTILVLGIIACTDSKKQIKYFESGSKESEGILVDGLKQGKWTFFEENGDTAQISHFRNDTLHGIEYLFSNNKIESITNFVNGVRIGEAITYHPNGSIKSRGKMENGVQSGIWEFFHENGSIYMKVDMKGNQLENLGNTIPMVT